MSNVKELWPELRYSHKYTGRVNGMTTYSFEIDDEVWETWKDTVPRSKSLDTRLRELIEADRDGRVTESDEEM